MKLMKYSLTLLFAVICIAQVEAFDKKEFIKELHESYQVASGAHLHITNKYGNITLDTWNKNEISIDVIIKVKTSSQSKADKIFEMINIDFSGDRHEVRAATELDTENYNESWWGSIFSDSQKGDYSINYKINIPAETVLHIQNKYGNIHSNQNTIGNAHLINKYGNIYTQNIDGNVKLELGYGNVTMGDVHGLNYTIKYSNGDFGNAGNVVAESKYSHFTLGDIGDFELESKYDGYEVGNAESFNNEGKYDKFVFDSVGKVRISTKYSSFNTRMLTGSLKMTGKYNGLKVKQSQPSVEKIIIEGKNNTIGMRISHDFQLDFTGEYVTPRLPNDFDKRIYEKDDEDIRIKGKRGSGNGTEIHVDMEYGDFKIVN